MKKRTQLLGLCFLVVAVLGGAVLVWRHPSVQDAMLSRGDLKTLKARVAADPADWRAQYWFGRRAAEAGDLIQAEPALRKALGLQPDFLPAVTELGKVSLAQNRVDEAYQLLRMAAGRDPRNLEARLALTVLYRTQGAYQQAMDEATAVLAVEPRHLQALYELGAAQALAQQTIKAEATFRQAIEIDPSDSAVRVGLARVLLQKGELAEAEAMARKTLATNADNTDAILILAQTLSRKTPPGPNREEALRLLQQAREREPNRTDLAWATGQILSAQGRWRETIAELSDLIRRDRDRTQAYFLLARAYRQLGRIPESRKAEAIFRERERYDRQVLNLGQQIATNPDRLDLRLQLGEVHAQAGHPDRAANVYQRALERDPNNARVRARLSSLLQQAVQK